MSVEKLGECFPLMGLLLPGGRTRGGRGTWLVCGGAGNHSRGLKQGVIKSNSFPQTEVSFNFALLVFVKPLIRCPLILLCI